MSRSGSVPLVPIRVQAANVIVAHQQAYRCSRVSILVIKFGFLLMDDATFKSDWFVATLRCCPRLTCPPSQHSERRTEARPFEDKCRDCWLVRRTPRNGSRASIFVYATGGSLNRDGVSARLSGTALLIRNCHKVLFSLILLLLICITLAIRRRAVSLDNR